MAPQNHKRHRLLFPAPGEGCHTARDVETPSAPLLAPEPSTTQPWKSSSSTTTISTLFPFSSTSTRALGGLGWYWAFQPSYRRVTTTPRTPRFSYVTDERAGRLRSANLSRSSVIQGPSWDQTQVCSEPASHPASPFHCPVSQGPWLVRFLVNNRFPKMWILNLSVQEKKMEKSKLLYLACKSINVLLN